MRFSEFIHLFEDLLKVGQTVSVPRNPKPGTTEPWIDSGWQIVNIDYGKGQYIVQKAGVGSKALAIGNLEKYQSSQGQSSQGQSSQGQSSQGQDHISTGNYDERFFANMRGKANNSADYIHWAKEWMRGKGLLNDGIVTSTEDTWYSGRLKEILTQIRSAGTIYRCITVPGGNLSNINWNSLGTSWAFEESGANCYWKNRDRDGAKDITLIGKAGRESVDIDISVVYYLIPHYAKEKELRLKKGSPVEIQGYMAGDFPNRQKFSFRKTAIA